MNEIEKEIEEMAKDIQKSVNGCAKYWATLIATYLYEQGYRQVKDKVVLTKENFFKNYMLTSVWLKYDKMYKEELAKASELKAETIRLAKQETAREILKALKNMAYQSNDWSHGEHPMVVEVDYIEEIAKEYEVEVE